MTTRRRFNVCASVACLAGLLACTDKTTPPPEENSSLEYLHWVSHASHDVMVFVVDDRDSAEAATLRKRITEFLRFRLLELATHKSGCGPNDPSVWSQRDLRIVVARPSAPDAPWLTSFDLSGLAWVTTQSQAQEVDPIITAVEQALSHATAQQGETQRPILAARRAIEVIEKKRSPASVAEADFVSSLPEDITLLVYVASTSDDEDLSPIGESFFDENEYPFSIYGVVLGPFTPTSQCWAPDLHLTRLGVWAEQQRFTPLAVSSRDPQCWHRLFGGEVMECGVRCHPRQVHIDDIGQASCRVFVDQSDISGCDAFLGRVDPDGQRTFVERGERTLRRCEITQLTGERAKACRTTLACEGCGSGFCATDVEQLLPRDACVSPEVVWPIRFVGGALQGDIVLSGACITNAPTP